ncbi:hypothetical protein R6Q57_010007 [Mikania cordata]
MVSCWFISLYISSPLSRFGHRRTPPPAVHLAAAHYVSPPSHSNKHVKALRSAPLTYPDLCIQLFEGYTSSGFDSWGASFILPHTFEDVFEHNLHDFDDIECTQMDPPLQGVSEESLGHSKKEIKKRKAKETITSQITEFWEHIKKLATMIIENHKASNDMEACMTKLGTVGWDESDAKY